MSNFSSLSDLYRAQSTDNNKVGMTYALQLKAHLSGEGNFLPL